MRWWQTLCSRSLWKPSPGGLSMQDLTLPERSPRESPCSPRHSLRKRAPGNERVRARTTPRGSVSSIRLFPSSLDDVITAAGKRSCSGKPIPNWLWSLDGIIPTNRQVVAITEGIQFNYISVLNILFLLLAAVLVIRFLHTGGQPMLRMMNTPAHDMSPQRRDERCSSSRQRSTKSTRRKGRPPLG